MEKKKLPVSGIKIKSIVATCMAFCVFIMVLIHIEISRVDRNCHNLINDTEASIEGQGCAISLGRSSDYLTENVRLFVVRQEPEYMERYFEEVDSENREKMVEKLRIIYEETEPETVARLEEALHASKDLEQLEIHAMRLVSYAIGIPEEQLPETVEQWELSEEEKNGSEEALIRKANDLVFGSEYLEAKEIIKTDINDTLDLITDRMKQVQRERGSELKRIFSGQRFFTLLMVLMIVAGSWMLGVHIVHPIKGHIRSIREGKKWDVTGAYELRYLACVYNQIFDQNEDYKKELEYKANHDALTGLYCRAAFDRIKEELEGAKGGAVALILADINKYKMVNDVRGHKAGDETLKKMAGVFGNIALKNKCCTARIGGDEFAILLRDVKKDYFPEIEAEVWKMNELLEKAEGEVPGVTVSVGVAFSEEGYSADLFRQADRAMYHAKRNHCMGACMFEDTMDLEGF